MGNKTVAIVICTEAGALECMSQMLVKSIRLFGGTLKDANIYSVQPRNPEPLSAKTVDVFNELGVHHEYKLLNRNYPDYGFANKVAACDYFAGQLSEDYLLFMDSDHVVFNDLEELLADPMADVRMRAVGQKGVGSDGRDENAAYWRELYKLCGVNAPTFVRTGIGGHRIFSYYNGGLIFARRTSGLFQQCKANFDAVMSRGLLPKQGLFFVEQSTLSATISGIGLKVTELPSSYNYSPQYHQYLSESNEQLDLDQIHTFHYHRLFKPPNKINLQRDFAGFGGEKLDWLKRELVDCGVNPQPFYEQWELELLAQKEHILAQMKKQGQGE